MNKTAKIIIAILILVCGFLVVFAQIQASEAQKQTETSLKYYQENQLLKAEAKRQTELAVRRTAEALEAQYETRAAFEQLDECEKSK